MNGVIKRQQREDVIIGKRPKKIHKTAFGLLQVKGFIPHMMGGADRFGGATAFEYLLGRPMSCFDGLCFKK